MRAIAAVLIAGCLAAVPAARADIKPDDEKQGEKEKPKGPDSEGRGPGVPQPQQKNPLPDIVDLMREVEQRLAESETSRWTQEEQQRIADALKGQESTVEKLKDLIKEVESQQSQGGGGGAEQQQRERQRGQQQREQQKQRERQQEQQQQPVDPQQQEKQKSEQEKQRQQNQQRDPNQRRRESATQPPDGAKADGAHNGAGGEQWGNLPPKQIREVLDAKSRPMPPRFRKQLEEYYKRLEETKSK